MRSRAASTSEARSSAPSPEPSSGSTACSGCGISPSTFPASLQTPATSPHRAVRVLRVAEDDLAGRLELGEQLRRRRTSTLAVLHGDRQLLPQLAARRERRLRPLDAHADVPAHERERRVRAQHARQQAGLAEDLEAVADPEHRARRRPRTRATASMHRGEAGDRAAAEVVAVREPAGEHDGAVSAGSSSLRVPDAAARRRRARRAPRAASRSSFEPGKDDHGDPRPTRSRRSADLDLVALDQRVREQLLAHPLDLGPRLVRRRSRRPRGRRPGPRARRRRRSRAGAASSRTASPCGSRMPAFGRTRTVAFTRARPRVGEVVVERDPGQPLERLDVARPRAGDDVVGQLRARGRSCPSRASRSSRGRTACRTTAAGRRARTRRPARSGTSRA